jgi:hypothetical protein
VNVGSGDFEDYTGRKDYAENVGGAYYSARLAVLEYLKNIKKQASVLVYREIGSEYSIPLGVWVIRESVRNAMKNKSKNFEDLNQALYYIMQNVIGRDLVTKSKLIKIVKTQKTLDETY